MINKEDIKVGDLVKVFDTTHDRVKIKVVERVNKLSFSLKHDWNPTKFNESQSCFKMTDEEIKKYYDEGFNNALREKNQYATKYLNKLEHISKLIGELKQEENITFSINIDDILKGISEEVIKVNKYYGSE